MTTRGKFVRDYTVQFIAAWAANNYTGYCVRGLHKELERPPIEDAIFLANQTWNASEELRAYLIRVDENGSCGII